MSALQLLLLVILCLCINPLTRFKMNQIKSQVNPFVPNALFLYPLKTSENRCFQGVEKGCIGKNGLNSVGAFIHD